MQNESSMENNVEARGGCLEGIIMNDGMMGLRKG